MDLVIGISRYLLPFLTFVILIKCMLSLLFGHPKEKTYGYIIDAVDSERYPLNMWETSIGRSNSCDIVIGYDTVSRFQAVISRRIDGWYIYDLLSKSGILVNGEKIDKKAMISGGDTLTFGNAQYRFEIADDPVQLVGKKKGKLKNQKPPISYAERPAPQIQRPVQKTPPQGAEANLYFDGEKWRPATNGMHFCLGDALSENDWEFIRLAIDNGYIENPQISGAIFIWSDRRMENELDALINYGNIHSAMWLARLSAAGAAIGGIAHIDYLEKLHGDIVVSNPSLMPEEETEKIGRYTGGRVIYIEDIPSRDVSEKTNPVQTGWPRPLEYAEVSEDIIVKTVNEINEFADVKIIKWFEHCGAAEVKTGKNTSRILIDNNEYYYVLPEIRTRRKIY